MERAEIRSWLVENGIDDLHSWRCNHPDIYGPCSCVDEFTDDLMEFLGIPRKGADRG